MRKRIPIFILLTVIAGSYHAAFSQSPMGLIFPFGSQIRSGSGSALSLAGTGVGIGNDFYGLSSNPANLGISGRTTFSSALSGDLLMIRDQSGGSDHLDMNLRLFSLTIPVGKFGAIGASFEPYSTTNTRFRIMQPFPIDNFFADTAELGIISNGGAICWQAGWGYSVKKLFRVGIAYKRFNFNQSLIAISQMHGTMHDRFVDSSRTSYGTNGVRGGLQIPFRTLTAGFTGEYYFIADAKRSTSISGTRDTLKLQSDQTFQLKPPPSVAFGLSWRISPRWLTACDVGAVLWDRYYSDLASISELGNAWFVSGGVQFIPAPDMLTPKLYEIIQYRAGIRYSQLPGTKGSEISGTIAAGLPMQTNGGLFDIIFDVGRRSDGRFNNYHENIIGIKLGINGARKWYQSSNESY